MKVAIRWSLFLYNSEWNRCFCCVPLFVLWVCVSRTILACSWIVNQNIQYRIEGPLYFLREAWLGLFFSRETWFKLLLIPDSWFTVKISFHVRVNAIFDFNVSRERRVELNVIREKTCFAWNNFRLFMYLFVFSARIDKCGYTSAHKFFKFSVWSEPHHAPHFEVHGIAPFKQGIAFSDPKAHQVKQVYPF